MTRDQLVHRLRDAGCVYAEDEATLLTSVADDPTHLEALVSRRVAGEPLETIVGWVELGGQRLRVRPGNFVPRQRTAFLARLAISTRPQVFVELCCGVGPIAAVVATAMPAVEVHAADLDPRAVATARMNLDGRAQVHEGDLFGALPHRLKGKLDVLAANAPYVPRALIATMPVEARLHEPRHALDGGPDGLDLHRRIAGAAAEWLRPGGALLIETSQAQAHQTAQICQDANFSAEILLDESLDATAVRAR